MNDINNNMTHKDRAHHFKLVRFNPKRLKILTRMLTKSTKDEITGLIKERPYQ
jgi:hypothetical protein